MKVRLTKYTGTWKTMYEQEVSIIHSIFGDNVLSFEHFGSTSVPGMSAKPIIDMMCIVKRIDTVDEHNADMEYLGYDIAGEWGLGEEGYLELEERIGRIICMSINLIFHKFIDI